MATTVALLLLTTVAMATEAPDLSLSLRRPLIVKAGRDALLTCVVHNLANHTLLWRRDLPEADTAAGGGGEALGVLTVGDYRVIDDPRVMVLHDDASVIRFCFLFSCHWTMLQACFWNFMAPEFCTSPVVGFVWSLSINSPGPSFLARNMKSDHVAGGDVFVLAIMNTTVEDSGMYICEVNTSPVSRSYHKLTVVTTDADITNVDEPVTSTAAPTTHDYSNCCRSKNVSESCLGLCSLTGLSQGGQVGDADCDSEFQNIVECMADGRNHLPCCQEQGVPPMCSGFCVGQYTPQTDSIRQHFSCATFSQIMVNCVAQGLDTLPAAPSALQVVVRSLGELQVSWTAGDSSAPAPDLFTVNVTRLRRFDGAQLGLDDNDTALEEGPQPGAQVQLFNVTASRMFLMVDALQPLTMYEVSVSAHNAYGSSLTSQRVRAVTWRSETSNAVRQPPPGSRLLPSHLRLYDVTDTCVPHASRCLRQLCDPRVASDTVVTDVIICAPWADKTFACMADGHDHSACCRARGLPQICVELCAGNVTKIDFRYFRCLGFMGSYASCLMQGYGVVPSAPREPRVALMDSGFAVVRWNPPEQLADTVQSYTLRVRPLRGATYITHTDVHAPYLLEDLQPATEYEFFVEAVNPRGPGVQSSRVIFQTLAEVEREEEAEQSTYSLSSCCLRAEMSPACMPLCHYDARMSTMRGLAHICAPEYHKLMRCSAGGRDHTPCCRRRGVPSACLPACRGQSSLEADCLPFVGNLWQCFEEGTGLLPPPVTALHASGVTNSSVVLIWEEEAQNVTGFQVRYGPVGTIRRSTLGMEELDQVLNVTKEFAVVGGLSQGQVYGFTVVSVNDHGTSLPTSVITVNVTAQDDVMQKAMTSHPHSLSVTDLSATELTISWAPPLISHPTDRIRYKISYRGPNATDFTNVTTAALSHRLQELQPNSQYIVFITALSGTGESRPSETLQLWTRPAYPAYVELPTIHPTDMVKEGGSMTVLCIAMASPEPTVALYINGRHVHEERTRHLVTSIRNVSRDMTQVTCYADNGYGTPMQSTRHIVISRRPIVTSRPEFTAPEGSSVTLRCRVDASPEPQMVFWRQPAAKREVVIDGGNFEVITQRGRKEGEYTMELKIREVAEENFGQFFCHAENVFGLHDQTR
ncbi:Ig-like and fibronectin type-III domain-containing protein 1 [Pollicipes pollicipes]|uniref:Ig-like and fibronectin type-III domain-containing protein 1 n=1 Tax=Pollicipes pollicipes TaxID=41117 RepID=UPI001885A084|nr:Ig-like and fibronectin type-III domain-containing protein 1 [Pollicipes pollicipes]